MSPCAAAAAAVLLLSACASTPTLVPAPGARLASPGGTIALASEAGATIRVDPDAWRGNVDIGNAVTPMHVQVENDTDRKLAHPLRRLLTRKRKRHPVRGAAAVRHPRDRGGPGARLLAA